jgi:hypothetical protein
MNGKECLLLKKAIASAKLQKMCNASLFFIFLLLNSFVTLHKKAHKTVHSVSHE